MLEILILPFVDWNPPEPVLGQTVKTKKNCSIMWHFIRVCTVGLDKIDLQRKNSIFFENYNL